MYYIGKVSLLIFFVLTCGPQKNTNKEPKSFVRQGPEVPQDLDNLKQPRIASFKQYSIENSIDIEYIAYRIYVDGTGKRVYGKSGIQKICIKKKEAGKEIALKWKEILKLWENNEAFIDFYIAILREAIFDACYLEFIPIVDEGDNDFEFVLYETKFDHQTDGTPFNDQKGLTIDGNVISFDSISKRSRLIVPTNGNLYDDTFAHIANFTKRGAVKQQYKLWQLVGRETLNLIKKKKGPKVFVSTHGKNVVWLHVRVENNSTLFSYNPYKI